MKKKQTIGNCPRCGVPYDSETAYCAKCGAYLGANIKLKSGEQLSYEETVMLRRNEAQYCLRVLSKKAKTSGRIWIITAIVQLLLSVIAFPFPFWVAAIASILWAVSQFKLSAQVLVPNKKLIAKYDSGWYQFFLVLSITIGGFIGLIGYGYDNRTRQYARENAGLIGWYCDVR